MSLFTCKYNTDKSRPHFPGDHQYVFTHGGVEVLIDVAAAAAVVLASVCFQWTHVLAKVNI